MNGFGILIFVGGLSLAAYAAMATEVEEMARRGLLGSAGLILMIAGVVLI